jgi:hypothetical protein
MSSRIVALIAVAAFASGPAWAQAPAPSAPVSPAAPPPGTVSPGSLLADGYEVKAITDISSDEQKVMWPNDTVSPYIMITLQKGNSVAVCGMSMVNWINLADTSLAAANLCKKR